MCTSKICSTDSEITTLSVMPISICLFHSLFFFSTHDARREKAGNECAPDKAGPTFGKFPRSLVSFLCDFTAKSRNLSLAKYSSSMFAKFKSRKMSSNEVVQLSRQEKRYENQPPLLCATILHMNAVSVRSPA